MPVIKAAQMPSWISAWIILNKYCSLKRNDKVIVHAIEETIFSKAITNISKYMGIQILNISNKSDMDIAESIKDGSIKLGITVSSSVSRTMTRLLGPKGVVVICDNDIIETNTKNYERIYFPIAKAIFTDVCIVGFNFNKVAGNQPEWIKDGISAIVDMMNNNFFQYIESYEENNFHKAIEFIDRTGKSVVLFTK